MSDRYHIIVPHITGYGKEAETVFTTQKAVADIVEIIRNHNQKIILIGFSLGAQLAFRITVETPELLHGAILVSPWLIKEKKDVEEVIKLNEKPYHMLQKKRFCTIVGMLNGLPSKQRNEFVEYMQKVQLETIKNSVDNGITLAAAPKLKENDVPILAIAWKKQLTIFRLYLLNVSIKK